MPVRLRIASIVLLEIANNCERYNLQPPGRLNLSQRENEIAAEDVANVVLIKAANVRDMADQIRACGIVRGDIFPDLQHLAEEFKGLP